MKFGRHKTRKRVLLKLVLVWCLSLATSMPLSLLYAADSRATIVDGVCQISVSLFQIIGSLFSFYIPLVIMLITYALTVRHLSQKESELLASGYEAPITTPLSHSVRLKRLLCKTTSTLSSTTATSIADTELSETAPSEEIEESETSINSPGRRPPYLRYASHYKKHGRNYAIREKSPNLEGGAIINKRGSYDCHLRPPLATSTPSDLSVFAKYDQDQISNAYPETPKNKSKSLSSNGTRKPPHGGGDKAFHEGNKMVEIRIIESNPLENPNQEDPDSEGGLNGTSVTVPCSCAPKFFLEGISRNANSSEICGDCSSQYEGISSQGVSENSELDQGRGTFFRAFLSKLLICHKGKHI